MMNQIFSILLSFFLLVSHMHLTIGTHFCGGEAIETKIIFGETYLGCGMMDMGESCDDSENSNNNESGFDKSPCCQNEYQTIQSTNEFVKDTAQITLGVEFLVAFYYTTLNLDLLPNPLHQFYTEFISPPLEKDIQVLFQSFLI